MTPALSMIAMLYKEDFELKLGYIQAIEGLSLFGI